MLHRQLSKHETKHGVGERIKVGMSSNNPLFSLFYTILFTYFSKILKFCLVWWTH